MADLTVSTPKQEQQESYSGIIVNDIIKVRTESGSLFAMSTESMSERNFTNSTTMIGGLWFAGNGTTSTNFSITVMWDDKIVVIGNNSAFPAIYGEGTITLQKNTLPALILRVQNSE